MSVWKHNVFDKIIMKELNQLDVSIINVEIKKSSLEQVFLKLTKNETAIKQ